MKVLMSALILGTAAFVTACEDPAANKPKASVEPSSNSSATNATAPATAPAAKPFVAKGEVMEVAPGNSTVQFVGSKVTGKHEGGFTLFSGKLDLVDGDPVKSSVHVDIDATSIFSDNDDLTTHLKSADFFDVAKYPKASFHSTQIVAGAKEPDNHTVTGDLDLHGVVKSITFPAKIDVTPETVTVKAGFSINRKDFGIAYAGKADDLIRDDVVIKLNLLTKRKK